MIRRLKLPLLASLAVAVSGLAFATSPAAAAKPACWKVVINDWYDGSIDGKYDLHCYREALAHLQGDLKGYSSAYDDINRALQRRIAEIAAAKKAASTPKKSPVATKPTKPSKPAKPAKPSKNTTTTPASDDNGNSNSNSTPAPPKNNTRPPNSSAPIPHRTGDTHSTGGTSTSKQQHRTKPNPTATPKSSSSSSQQATPSAPVKGRDTQGAGPVQSAIKSLGPSKATSIPIPLVVLAGLAALLMLIGAASIVAKRAQNRRPATVPVRESH
jgi:cobalamin biosynthesis Mg chelatase CobN